MVAAAQKTFLITGVSSGLGHAFAEGALAAGHRVVGTVRRQEDADASAGVAPDRAFPLVLDVTDYAANPPVRLFLGEDALSLVDQKLKAIRDETKAWDALSRSTSFVA